MLLLANGCKIKLSLKLAIAQAVGLSIGPSSFDIMPTYIHIAIHGPSWFKITRHKESILQLQY